VDTAKHIITIDPKNMKSIILPFCMVLFVFLGNAQNTSEPLLAPNQDISASGSVVLKFLQFNIWQEGTSVPNGMAYIRDAIHESNPDIVCFSEVRNYDGDWTTKMVNDLATLGKAYYRGYSAGADVSIISKYPIVKTSPTYGTTPDGHGSLTTFEINVNGQLISVTSAHLDYTHYACYLPRGYACGGFAPYQEWEQIGDPHPVPVTDLPTIIAQNAASFRAKQIAQFLDFTKNDSIPCFILGDFNEPSHLDWTIEQADLFAHHGVVYEWPLTLALQNNGYVDAYREVFPDEVLNPGFTWPAVATGAGCTSWTPHSDDRDRIDYIFYKGSAVQALEAAIVGPAESYVACAVSLVGNEGDLFECAGLPWASDHKGVVVVFRVGVAE
jgi:endonuclease/exonuclease/phosphatase family metal-dependent hydrolase